MAVDLDDYYDRRHRRQSTVTWRAALNIIFFILSLIPASILAWKMDVAGLFGRQQQQPEAANEDTLLDEHAARIEHNRRMAELRRQAAELAAWRQVDTRAAAPEAPKPQTIELPPPPPERHEITLSLKRDEQSAPLPLKSPRLVAVEGCPVRHDIEPADGTLPATVFIEGPAKLYVSLNGRGRVEIKASTPTSSLSELPFSTGRMKNLLRAAIQQRRNVVARISALTSERQTLASYVASPGLKPATWVQTARTRIAEIDELIKSLQNLLSTPETEIAAMNAMVELAEYLDGKCKLVFEESVSDFP